MRRGRGADCRSATGLHSGESVFPAGRRPRPLLRFRPQFHLRPGRQDGRNRGDLEQPPHQCGPGADADFKTEPLEIGADGLNRDPQGISSLGRTVSQQELLSQAGLCRSQPEGTAQEAARHRRLTVRVENKANSGAIPIWFQLIERRDPDHPRGAFTAPAGWRTLRESGRIRAGARLPVAGGSRRLSG